MPTSPSADPSQKDVLNQMVSLSQNSAVSTGNQIAVVDDQTTKFQDAQNLFQSRYDYWDKYITAYHQERKLLNGVFTLQPIVMQDFLDFLNTIGRLYQKSILNPIRIAQFDQIGASPTGTEVENETLYLTRETKYRAYLQSGFTSPSLPTGFILDSGFSSISTTMTIRTSTSTQESLAANGTVLVYDTSSPTAGVIVEYLTFKENVSGISPNQTYTYTLEGLKFTSVFTVIAAGSFVSSSGPVFSNSERTSKTTSGAQQSRLNAYIEGYKYRGIQNWSDNLTAQVAQIAAEATAGEDMPDTAYNTAIQNIQTALTTYLTTMDVSDSGLTTNQTSNATRTSANPARISWIDARLIQQTKAYDERYNYANKIYNLSDGTYPLLQKFQGQKTQLASQQAASNYRASQLSAETF